MLNFQLNGLLIPNHNIKPGLAELEDTFLTAIPSIRRSEIFKFVLMKKLEMYKLIDLIEEIRKLDELIGVHRKTNASLSLNQYENKKTKLIGTLFDELASPSLQSAQSYILIKKILDKYYPYSINDSLITDSDIGKLAAVI